VKLFDVEIYSLVKLDEPVGPQFHPDMEKIFYFTIENKWTDRYGSVETPIVEVRSAQGKSDFRRLLRGDTECRLVYSDPS
jgi:hypothetical protein